MHHALLDAAGLRQTSSKHVELTVGIHQHLGDCILLGTLWNGHRYRSQGATVYVDHRVALASSSLLAHNGRRVHECCEVDRVERAPAQNHDVATCNGSCTADVGHTHPDLLSGLT